MTCTVGFIDGTKVLIATDSASSDDNGSCSTRKGNSKSWFVTIRTRPSIRLPSKMQRFQFIVGFAGNFSDCQFLRHVFEWPVKTTKSFTKYLLRNVFPEIKRQMKDYGIEKTDSNWTLLFGTPGTSIHDPARLYILNEHGDVEETEKPFAVIGSGADYALGSLEATTILLDHDVLHLPALKIVTLALTAAEENHTQVRHPFHVISL